MLNKISYLLDAVADSLEAKGLIKEAYEIDKVADEMDSLQSGSMPTDAHTLYDKFRNPSFNGAQVYLKDGNFLTFRPWHIGHGPSSQDKINKNDLWEISFESSKYKNDLSTLFKDESNRVYNTDGNYSYCKGTSQVLSKLIENHGGIAKSAI
jgi:hypothetical protein